MGGAAVFAQGDGATSPLRDQTSGALHERGGVHERQHKHGALLFLTPLGRAGLPALRCLLLLQITPRYQEANTHQGFATQAAEPNSLSTDPPRSPRTCGLSGVPTGPGWMFLKPRFMTAPSLTFPDHR